MNRDFQFSIGRSVPEHFNHSVGNYVSNEQSLRDSIKRMGEEQFNRTGMETDYQYLSAADYADSQSHGVTDEGLDATRKVRHESG